MILQLTSMVPLCLLLFVVALGGDFLHHGSTNGKYHDSFFFVHGVVIPPTISPIPTVTLYPFSISPSPSFAVKIRAPAAPVVTPTAPVNKPTAVTVVPPTAPVVTPASPVATPAAPVAAPTSPVAVPTSPVAAPTVGPAPTSGTGASPPATSPSRGGTCFSSFNTVYVKYVGDIPINQVKIGDYIKTRNDQFTQVYGFGHYDHNMDEEFIQIIISDVGKNSNHSVLPFEVTAQHLVFVERNNQLSSISASDIVVGDYLNGNIVESIHTVRRRGVYAPLTQSGDFFINGSIVVSNYINILQYNNMNQQHIIGHALFFPQRLLCKYFINTCKQETYINGYGYLAYVTVQSGSFINKYGGGWFTSMIILLICIPINALFTIMEESTTMTMFRCCCCVAVGTATLVIVIRRRRTIK